MSDKSGFDNSVFESIKHINEYGSEYWYARDLQKSLNYAKWDNFEKVIEVAKLACTNSGNNVTDHFLDVGKMIKLGKGGNRDIRDIQLSRYACYLIVQNGDPRKQVIAEGQTYFALQTRRLEIQKIEEVDEETKRLMTRAELREHNKRLVDAARGAGVVSGYDFAIFQNMGYKGLYGGLSASDIHQKKGLKPGEEILDNMNFQELAANLFRAAQTEEKIRRDNIEGKLNANLAHLKVGKKVRQTIKELGGTMPEDQPTPAKSIKQIEEEMKKSLNPGVNSDSDGSRIEE